MPAPTRQLTPLHHARTRPCTPTTTSAWPAVQRAVLLLARQLLCHWPSSAAALRHAPELRVATFSAATNASAMKPAPRITTYGVATPCSGACTHGARAHGRHACTKKIQTDTPNAINGRSAHGEGASAAGPWWNGHVAHAAATPDREQAVAADAKAPLPLGQRPVTAHTRT
jgi:hypothetical protein